jgi:hypothetical protein
MSPRCVGPWATAMAASAISFVECAAASWGECKLSDADTPGRRRDLPPVGRDPASDRVRRSPRRCFRRPRSRSHWWCRGGRPRTAPAAARNRARILSKSSTRAANAIGWRDAMPSIIATFWRRPHGGERLRTTGRPPTRPRSIMLAQRSLGPLVLVVTCRSGWLLQRARFLYGSISAY